MSEKIKPEHLQRAAYVYVRQSSPQQVRYHREGQQLQYDFAERARQLGFLKVVVIDEDQGRSSSGLQERPGFGRLLAAVCQGLAGAVLAREAARLARNNRDWHHLIDLCGLTDTLIIDTDGVYDPKMINDRLLLGLKGTMSEFELNLMRQRARQAFLQKAKRGCAMWEVPGGFIRSEEGQIEKTPDRQVQQGLEMFFKKFRELNSARQTFIWLCEEQLLLPRAKAGTSGQEVEWLQPTLSRVHQLLRNPCYAGAFAFGRTSTKTLLKEDRLRRSSSRCRRAQEAWQVLILDHHAGYISWSDYLHNQQVMARNLARRENAGAIKKGSALLSGLLRCGRCGRKLQVGYSGTRGEVGRYLCCGSRNERGSGSCLAMGSLRLDQVVAEQVLEAIEPAGIQAALQASEASSIADQEKRKSLELALERGRYEANRAKRQYDAVDPENRLVASELEARWNSALKNVADLEARLQTVPTSVPATLEQKKRLMELGADLPLLWKDPQTSVELKKQILRAVIEEIVVNSLDEPAEHRLQIHWAGGVHTEVHLPRNKTGMHRRMADGKVIDLVGELAKVCDDKTIAGVLNRLGYRTGQDNSWSASRVTHFRHTHGIASFTKQEGWRTLEQAATFLQVSHTAVKTLIRKGILPARQVVKCAPWIIDQKELAAPTVQAAVRAAKAGRHVSPTVTGQQELAIK